MYHSCCLIQLVVDEFICVCVTGDDGSGGSEWTAGSVEPAADGEAPATQRPAALPL